MHSCGNLTQPQLTYSRFLPTSQKEEVIVMHKVQTSPHTRFCATVPAGRARFSRISLSLFACFLFLPGCDRSPSRSEIQSIILESLQETKNCGGTENITTYDAIILETDDSGNYGGLGDNERSRDIMREAEAGIVNAKYGDKIQKRWYTTYVSEPSEPGVFRPKTVTVYEQPVKTRLTDQARGLVIKEQKDTFRSGTIYYYKLNRASVTDVQITGIRELDSNKEIIAEYSYTCDIFPLIQKLDASRGKNVPAEMTNQATAHLVKFDDGWRLDD